MAERWRLDQGPPKYKDGTPMIVDGSHPKNDQERTARLRAALEEIINLPDDHVYARARGIALRALNET